MKWVKRITTLIILIILILLMASTMVEARSTLTEAAIKIYDYQWGNTYYKGFIGYSSNKPMYPFNTTMAYERDNVYCLHKDQNLGGGSDYRSIVMYTATAKVVIKGNEAKFYTFSTSTKDFTVLKGSVTATENNVLACILQKTTSDGRKRNKKCFKWVFIWG